MSEILLLSQLLVGIVYPEDATVELFTPLEHSYTGGRYENESFGYRLYIPDRIKADRKAPLIVWLHGHGEGGTKNNREQLAWLELIFKDFKHLRYPPFFMLATQCPPDNRSWGHFRSPEALAANGKGDEPITILREIIDKTIREYAIDTARITLAGVSSGGSGCWNMAMRYPRLFAAVAPMASSGGRIEGLDQVKEIPIWAFHSKADNPGPVRRTVQVLGEIGGRCHLTEVPGSSHYCQKDAFLDYDLLGWLLSQQRGSRTAPQPGLLTWGTRWNVLRRDWLNWNSLVPWTLGGVILATITIAWRNEQRRRKERKGKESDLVGLL